MNGGRLKFRVWGRVENRYRGEAGDDIFMLTTYGVLVFCGVLDGKLRQDYYSKFIVEQCTGLKDKDGSAIYEGDILEMKRNVFLEEFKVERYAVEYSPMLARWRLGKSCIYLNKDTAAECKIVGNIHQNAEDSKK